MAVNAKGLVVHFDRPALLCLLLLFFFSFPAFALPDKPASFPLNDYASAKKYLTEFIEDWMDDESVPGLSLALIDGNNTIWSQGFGYSDKGKKTSANPATVYRIGGVTTLFTAVAIMQLVDQGKFGLDEPLKKLVPKYSTKSHWTKNRPITIRHLLTHHSGLPITLYKGMWSSQPESNDALLQRLSETYISYRPGEVYAFSNLGYVLLGMVIENVTGISYQEYVQKNIIDPLGMKNTSFDLNENIKSKLATGYKKDEAKALLFARDIASMGLYSTAEDVSKLLTVFLGETSLLSLSAREAMMISHFNPELNMGRKFGFAWNIDDKRLYQVERVMNRWGSTLMYRARVMMLPDYGLGVVVLANSSKGFRAIDKISLETIRVALEVKEGIKHDVEKNQAEALAPIEKPAQFIGEYQSLAGYVSVKANKKDYIANLLGWDVHLKPTENGWYSAQYDLLGILPIKLDWFAQIRVAAASVADESSVVINYNGQTSLFASPLPAANINEQWLSRVGEYRVANPDELTAFYEVDSGRIWSKNGRLFFSYKFPMLLPTTIDLPIVPLDKDMAIIPGKGSAFNETIRVERSGGKERILFSGYQLERIEPSSLWFF
ncbi:MAG: beta-lactamase family protein [Gammaproteobacteria bacterium]|nr:beta-lactamase family protein [Gammaproteobacteria bacterium]